MRRARGCVDERNVHNLLLYGPYRYVYAGGLDYLNFGTYYNPRVPARGSQAVDRPGVPRFPTGARKRSVIETNSDAIGSHDACSKRRDEGFRTRLGLGVFY